MGYMEASSGELGTLGALAEMVACCGIGRKVPMEEPEKSLMQKAGDVVATCSFRRFMPLPIGAFLMSIVSVPWCILYFPATTFRHIPHIVTAVQRLNHSKYLYYVSANTSDDACCNSCCKYFHPYLLMYLIVTLVLFIVVLPLLLVIFPILGVVHATYAVARRTYTESDMYDEAQDGGILDSLGIGDSKKEDVAEAMKEWPLGIGLSILWVGDWLVLTGLLEGAKKVEDVRYFHGTLLSVAHKALDVVVWLEDKTHFVNMLTTFKQSGSATEAVIKDRILDKRREDQDKAENRKKTPPRNIAGFIATMSLIVGLAFWPVFFVTDYFTDWDVFVPHHEAAANVWDSIVQSVVGLTARA